MKGFVLAAKKKDQAGAKGVGGKAVAVAMSAMMVWSQAGYATAAIADELNGEDAAIESVAGGQKGRARTLSRLLPRLPLRILLTRS